MEKREKLLIRRWDILNVLKEGRDNGGVSTKELVDIYKVTPATLYKDIKALKTLGFNIVHTKSGWLLKKDFGFNSWWEDIEVLKNLKTLHSLIYKRTPLVVEYETTSQKRIHYEVDPILFSSYNSEYFLVARERFQRELIILALSRLKIVKVFNNRKFRMPSHKTVSHFFEREYEEKIKKELYKVEVLFPIEYLPFFKTTIFHPTQIIIQEEGSNGFKVNFHVASLKVALRWTVSFDDRVEIISPLSLKKLLVNYCSRLLQTNNVYILDSQLKLI